MPVKLEIDDPLVQAWILSHQVFNSLIKYEEQVFTASGLTPQQFMVFMAIKDRPEPVNQIDVGGWLDRNPNSITLIIDRMEKDGLVKRARDLKDRRSVHLTITPEGEKIYTETRKFASQVITDTMSELSAKEIKAYIRVMEKLRDQTYLKRRLNTKVEEIQSVISRQLTITFREKQQS